MASSVLRESKSELKPIFPEEVKFGMSGFHVDRFESTEYARNPEVADPVQFHHTGSFNLDLQRGVCEIVLVVRVEHANRPLGSIQTTSIFKIEDAGKLVNKGTLNIPHLFLVILAGLSYSTTRGALVAMGKGTCFEKFVMPAVDPTRLLENPALK